MTNPGDLKTKDEHRHIQHISALEKLLEQIRPLKQISILFIKCPFHVLHKSNKMDLALGMNLLSVNIYYMD